MFRNKIFKNDFIKKIFKIIKDIYKNFFKIYKLQYINFQINSFKNY